MTETSDKDQTGDQDFADYLRSESPRRPEQPGVLDLPRSAPPGLSEVPSPEARDPDVRDVQKSLVERIADVDDDRRRSAVQLRKALETHRDEIRAQRRRDHAAMLVLAGIGIILLAAMVLLFTQLLQTKNELEQQIAARQASTVSTAQAAAADEPADAPTDAPPGPLEELADAVESIADRLTSLEGRSRMPATPPSTAAPAENGATGESAAATAAPEDSVTSIDVLEARVGALLDERLASVEARIDELRQSLHERPIADPDQRAAAVAVAEGAQGMATEAPLIVLQLAGLSSRDAVQRFIDKHELPAQVYVKTDSVRGQTWYGLIHSLHPDMDAAEAARTALPQALSELDVWLRPLPEGTSLEVLKVTP
jgi:DamX protein